METLSQLSPSSNPTPKAEVNHASNIVTPPTTSRHFNILLPLSIILIALFLGGFLFAVVSSNWPSCVGLESGRRKTRDAVAVKPVDVRNCCRGGRVVRPDKVGTVGCGCYASYERSAVCSARSGVACRRGRRRSIAKDGRVDRPVGRCTHYGYIALNSEAVRRARRNLQSRRLVEAYARSRYVRTARIKKRCCSTKLSTRRTRHVGCV